MISWVLSMGVFIYIVGPYPCPACGKALPDWQCKRLDYDGYPVALVMQRYRVNKKMSGEMHAICPTCGYVPHAFQKGKLIAQDLKQRA